MIIIDCLCPLVAIITYISPDILLRTVMNCCNHHSMVPCIPFKNSSILLKSIVSLFRIACLGKCISATILAEHTPKMFLVIENFQNICTNYLQLKHSGLCHFQFL